MPLPAAGSVLGVDVGFSPTAKTGAACRLDWTSTGWSWTVERFAFERKARRDTIERVVAQRTVLTAALDGPLHPTLEIVAKYRAAERLLTSGFQPRIGKPGQSSSPVGMMLNAAASDIARLLLELGCCSNSVHEAAIHDRSLVEAFPTAFIGVLLPEAERDPKVNDALSDRFYVEACLGGRFEKLLETILPGRGGPDLRSLTHHDDRAGLVCALTALSVAARDYVAVGDEDGYIILPPATLVQEWAHRTLQANAARTGHGRVVVETTSTQSVPS